MKITLCAALALCLAAAAAPSSEAASDAPRQPRAPRQASVKIIPSPSHESGAERDRRLKRECKGRPNAGACLGYAS